MKRPKTLADDDDMLPAYDFSKAVRGKYYEHFRQGSNVVVLDPDVSEAFPNAQELEKRPHGPMVL